MGGGLWSLDVDWDITPSGESAMEYFRRRPEVPVKGTFSIFAGRGFSVRQTANCNGVVVYPSPISQTPAFRTGRPAESEKFHQFPQKSTESWRCSEGPAGVAGVHIRCAGLRFAPPDVGETDLRPVCIYLNVYNLYTFTYIHPPPRGGELSSRGHFWWSACVRPIPPILIGDN